MTAEFSQPEPSDGSSARGDDAQRQSEEKYRLLFDVIDEGFCIIQMLYDGCGEAVDYRFLEVNPAFKKHSRLENAVGKTVRELIPNYSPDWIEFYGNVAESGSATRFETFTPRVGKWFEVYAFRAGDPEERKVGLLFNDITARKGAEEQAREAAALDRFRVGLDNALRPLGDPVEIQTVAARLIGEYLGANRTLYVEVHGSDFVVHRDYTNGVSHLSGTYRLETFGQQVVTAGRAGQTVVERDVAASPNFSEEQQKKYAQGEIGSFVGVPLVKDGELVASLTVHCKTARDWKPSEIALIEETADRTWGAVERARAEGVLRISEERQAFLLKLSDALRPLVDAKEIQAVACRMLGERLGISRASYAEIDGDDFIIRRSYTRDVSSMEGRFPLKAFGESMLEAYRRGETVIVQDVDHDPRYSPADRESFRASQIRAFVGSMLVKGGEWVGSLAVQDSEPRQWKTPELDLIHEVAERTWEAVERARTEEELRESQATTARERRLYEAILTNTPDLAYIFDLNHRFIYANEILLTMWGKTREESIGKTCLELGYEPWHAEMHDREIDRVAATKQPLRGEVPFHGTFGRRIYDYIFVPVFGPTGEVEAVAGTTRDVTDRKEADRRKDEFLATLAHELRNPLAPIRSSMHILQMSAHGDANVKKVCEMIERQVNHMVRLVDDLMEVSRITRGTIELKKEDTSLAGIIRSAVDTSNPIIAEGKHQLAISLPSEPILVHGDPVRLSQVISNLLNNSAKYTDAGGQIWLTGEQAEDEIVICVRDNGIGIPPEKLPLVFDMFMQVDRSNQRAQGGLGIGLTLVKRLVELHDGKISAHSAGDGQGSEFVIRLPVVADQVRSRPVPGSESSTQHVQQRRVLVVDDNKDAATTLGMLVKVLGSEVRTANGGAKALEILESFHPDLILLDLGMPGMDGYEVARRIRQISKFDKTILVALTGWGQDSDRERTHEAGFNHHLVKPAGINELQILLGSE